MRTTLTIEDEAMAALRKYAADRKLSLGRAASDLILRGIESIPVLKTKGAFAMIELPPGSPPITDERIKQIEEELYEEEYREAMFPQR